MAVMYANLKIINFLLDARVWNLLPMTVSMQIMQYTKLLKFS